jgi:hypothetical protein
MLLAAAAASAVLAVTAPGAYAADGWDHDDSSHSKEHDKGGSHEKPHGGVHTGGGALTAVNDGTSDGDHSAKHDSHTSKDSEHGGKDSSWTKDSEDSWSGGHKKPHGGVHTGGGALTAVNDGTSDGDHSAKHDSHTSKDSEHGGKDSSWTKDSEDSWSGGHKKPHGGVHTGGGALAAPTVTAGGLAVLAVAGSGLYVARRKKSVPGPA